mmetsp:Transcript_2076/g.3938  ORF Transcript_2076/g.3938 Transcript_2076/m.3938 type:complete len:386 (-) Transcript_2076:65-1222(-)
MSVVDLTSPETEEVTVSKRITIQKEAILPMPGKKLVLSNRNTDTRFDLTKKRKAPAATSTYVSSTTRKVNKGARGRHSKKQCELGVSCPYKEEYQHLLEFHHNDHDGPAHSTGSSLPKSTRLGTGNANKTTTSLGHRVRKDSGRQLGRSDPWQGEKNEAEMEYVECPICTSLVELHSYDKHLQVHESNQRHTVHRSPPPRQRQPSSATRLRQEQDDEYEKAELQDLVRMLHRHESEKGESHEEKKTKSNEVIDLENDVDSEVEISTPRPRCTLPLSVPSSEPTTATGPRISLAFRFKLTSPPSSSSSSSTTSSSKSKVVQSFCEDCQLKEVFNFLDHTPALAGVTRWELRSSFGNRTFNRKKESAETLRNVGIVANTLLIVQQID